MNSVDFIIVGQGIAGTLFAHECQKSEQSFVMFDAGDKNASLTAAGMYNPVVLKRFAPVWQAEKQIQHAQKMAAEIEQKLAIKIDYRFDILRILNSEKEKNTWQDKSTLPVLERLLDCSTYAASNAAICAPHQLGRVKLGGRIDLELLLSTYRQYFLQQQVLIEKHFDYSQLLIKSEHCQYQTIQAKNIVFCEGYGLKNNPYFSHLPLKGNKGEVMVVRVPELKLQATIKSGVFIMPMPERGVDVFFVGATYNWTDKDAIPTAAGKEELLEKVKKILSKEAFSRLEVIEHRAAMRPTVVDRRPLLGRSEKYPRLWVLNGLGTRGVMLGASMASALKATITAGEPLADEVNINRFK